MSNPQTLNLYGMVADDPETFADLDGHGPNPDCDAAGNCRLKIPTWQQFQRNLEDFYRDLPGNFAQAYKGASLGAADLLKDANHLLNDVGVDTGATGHAIDSADTYASNDAQEAGKAIFTFLSLLGGGGEAKAETKGASIIDHLFANPRTLKNLNTEAHAAEIGAFLEKEGWKVTKLGRGGHAGQGMRALEVNAEGKLTGRAIFWHPGGGHHGIEPYWKFSSPKLGTVRVGPHFK